MLQEKKLVDRVLSIVLGLIPANPAYNDPLSMQISSITKKLTHSKSMFENDIQLNPNGNLKFFFILFIYLYFRRSNFTLYNSTFSLFCLFSMFKFNSRTCSRMVF